MKNPITVTTLCYLEKDGSYLMLHRTKKKHDLNEGKWIGVGGHFEEGESPEECIRREVLEETGYTMHTVKLRGIITFCSPRVPEEIMFLYTSDDFSGTEKVCDEGELRWIPKDEILNLPLWEGDRVFLPMLDTRDDIFSLKLIYDAEDHLIEVK
ncbi:MAG: 8-oxo-dGTP diphosphatase [Lachnospiraceae bacterium]|nr:8-oxo-dGTP diphosphatase [Lachnospiraceae bacterium]